MPTFPFYIGSFSVPSPWAGAPNAHGVGICRAELEIGSGEIIFGAKVRQINPSFLVRNGEAGLLWTVTEPEYGGEVVCYREGAGGALALVGQLSSGADAPCHLAIDWRRRLGFVAHYHGGRVATLSLADDGGPRQSLALTAPPAMARGEDRSGARAHPHASLPLADGEFLVTDTGRDLVLLYKLSGEPSTSGVELLDALPLPEGSGPRHMAHRTGAGVVFVSNQNSGGVSIIARIMTGNGPRLEFRGVAPAPGLGRARPVPSEIAVHPISDCVYLANRMDNSLSVFSIESESGELAARGCIDVMGRNPRHFGISPDGRFLIAANQDSDDLAIFRIGEGGRDVAWTGRRFDVASPSAICF
ncbi:MAG TPA: beta-propeller fold lactonase family protein [Roseiarcus sp.]|nr:beta-propeller fold lactonase family protein [Roseiarcus sp.]